MDVITSLILQNSCGHSYEMSSVKYGYVIQIFQTILYTFVLIKIVASLNLHNFNLVVISFLLTVNMNFKIIILKKY